MCYESFCCMGGCGGALSDATNMPWFNISANEKDEKVWRVTVQHYLDDLPENRWLVSLNCKEWHCKVKMKK